MSYASLIDYLGDIRGPERLDCPPGGTAGCNVSDAYQDRQSQELAEILQNEINEYGRRLRADGKQPMLNAVASAVVTVTGAMLASVEDRRIRKELRRVMDRGLPRAIAAYEGNTGSVEIVIAGRRADA